MRFLTSISSELSRRSGWQILGSYAVGAWLVLQLAETLSSLLGLPLWFGSAVISLLVAGAPALLLTTFIQSRRPSSPDTTERGSTGAKGVFTWRNTLFAGLGVVLLFVATTGGYLGLRQLGVGPFGTLQAKGIIAFEERLVLAEFENRTEDPTLGETVTALMRIDLSQSSAITLLEPAQIAPVLARMEWPSDTPMTLEVAIEVAVREGLKAVVAGEVLPLGRGFVISARLVSVSDGSALIAERTTGSDVGDIPAAVDRLSAKLRERIGESLRTIQGDPPLEDVTTSSIGALHRYAQALRVYDAGDYVRAVSLLEESLALDSTFAMASRKLGVTLNNGGLDPNRAALAFERAYERRDRLTERERYLAEAAYHSYVEEDPAAAIDAYRLLLDRYPTDGVAMNTLAILLDAVGRLAEAEDVYWRAIQQGTAPPATYSSAMGLQSRLGMHDRVEETQRLFAMVFPDHPAVLRTGASLASGRYDYAGAEELLTRLLETSLGNAVWESVALFELGDRRLARGRLAESRQMYLRGYDISVELGPSFAPQPRELFAARIDALTTLVFMGQPERARSILDGATSGARWDSTPARRRDDLTFARLYAQAGRPGRARSLLEAHDAEFEAVAGGDQFSRVGRLLAVGEVAVAERRYHDAIQEYRKLDTLQAACPLCGTRELGEAYGLTGDTDAAVTVYERYLASRVLYRSGTDASNLWRTLLALGLLYEGRGEPERAIEMYARFVDLWADADAPLQERVAAAREDIERLRLAVPTAPSN